MSGSGFTLNSSSSLRTRFRNAAQESTRTAARAVGLNLDFYRAAYYDVRQFDDAFLLQHWMLTGRRESRVPSWSALARAYRSAGIDPANFDPIVYYSVHADLPVSGIDCVEAACVHYLRHGHGEGRTASLPMPDFLDTFRHPELLDKGWTAPPRLPVQPSQKEHRARLAFSDSFEEHLLTLDAEEFAITCFERYLGYLPELPHFDGFVAKLDVNVYSRTQWFIGLVSTAQDVLKVGLAPRQRRATAPRHEDLATSNNDRHAEQIKVMGIDVMSTGEWHYRAYLDDHVRYAERPTGQHSLPTQKHDTASRSSTSLRGTTMGHNWVPQVSVLCSMYRTGDLLIPFLASIRSQTLFSFTEFILVLVEPSDFERQMCAEFARRHANVVFLVSEHRLGIYEAWNLGVARARGAYLTNMNVDDLRSPESLEKQAALLTRFEWVDVVYQDVMVNLDSRLNWDNVVRTGAHLHMTKSGPTTFASYRNPPHNAPMWRRSLHDELGLFDESLVSAGDFDFWFRCAEAGKVFYNVSDAHVGYFINPDGLSTRKETRGFDEGREIVRRYRNVFVRGPRPDFIDDDTRALDRPRSERATLGVIAAVHRIRARAAADASSSGGRA